MLLLAKILTAVVAIEHLYIMWLEMFAWTTRAPKVFKSLDKDLFPKTKSLAANQGLYNGFLAAGLFWSLVIDNVQWQYNVALFFLLCVAVAAIYGALTAQRSILFVQGGPAFLALAAWLVCRVMTDGLPN
jgi:putative membrane protein